MPDYSLLYDATWLDLTGPMRNFGSAVDWPVDEPLTSGQLWPRGDADGT